jgi:hypothetical protein
MADLLLRLAAQATDAFAREALLELAAEFHEAAANPEDKR